MDVFLCFWHFCSSTLLTFWQIDSKAKWFIRRTRLYAHFYLERGNSFTFHLFTVRNRRWERERLREKERREKTITTKESECVCGNSPFGCVLSKMQYFGTFFLCPQTCFNILQLVPICLRQNLQQEILSHKYIIKE